MTTHAFVDESKERGLLVCAAVLAPADLSAVRVAMRGLVHPGSERVHMSKERPTRRGLIARTVARLPVQVLIYDAQSFGPREELKAREECLRRLVADLAKSDCRRLVLERDQSVEVHDRRVLYAAVHARGLVDQLTYHHMKAKEEPLLWIADAVAWCWTKGGGWRDQITPVVTGVRRV